VAQLFENFVQSFFVKADNQFLADTQHRRTKSSRAAENHSSDLVFVVTFLQVEADKLLPSSDEKFFQPVQQFERVVAFVTDFAGVDFLDRVDTVLRKKLLRFFTGRSARSVIAPVNLRHLLSFLCEWC
jgi:hypothetical protein